MPTLGASDHNGAMRLTTIRTRMGTAAARLDGENIIELAAPDLASLLRQPDWQSRAQATGAVHREATAQLEPAVRPAKTICVGQNYRAHILEMGSSVPDYPALFVKFASALIGANDPIVKPPDTDQLDYEVELGVVIGTTTRRVDANRALDHVAGYTVVNDISIRDWQFRTSEWLQGKSWDDSSPVGPVMVTTDELDAEDLRLWCEVDGSIRQDSRTSNMVFGVGELVSYISQFTTLYPGDLIATGTPGGVGFGRQPPEFLTVGQTVRCGVEGIGEMTNPVIAEQ